MIPETHCPQVAAATVRVISTTPCVPLSRGWIGFAKSFCGSVYPAVLAELRAEGFAFIKEDIEIAVVSLITILGPQPPTDLFVSIREEIMGLINLSEAGKHEECRLGCGVGSTLAFASGLGGDRWSGVAPHRLTLESHYGAVAEACMRVMKRSPRKVAAACARAASHPFSEPVQGAIGLEEYFRDTLFPAVLRELSPAVDLDPDDIAIVTLITALGPMRPVCPPTVLCEELFAHILSYALTQPEDDHVKWIVQLVLAYGNGWGRKVRSGKPAWDQPWPSALQELVGITVPHVRRAYHWLAMHVRGFNLGGSMEWLKDDATMIAAQFVLRIPKVDSPKKAHYQSILYWDPTKSQLYNWLKRAANGAGVAPPIANPGGLDPHSHEFSVGGFEGSLLYEAMHERKDIAVGQVAFQAKCQCDIGKGDQPDDHELREYNRGICSSGEHSVFIVYRKLLVVPGVSALRSFWLCKESEPPHYFELNHARCPICEKGTPSIRPTVLLVDEAFGMLPPGGNPTIAVDPELPEDLE